MHARAAVFDLYGDHLARRGGWAPIAAVVRLLGAVDVRPEAVRTAVSRLSREGWLEAREHDGTRGYAMTPRAQRRLSAAWERIYRSGAPGWDGRWHLVVLAERIADRSRRARVAESLTYLGYARMAPDTWIAPRPSSELDSAVGEVPVHAFSAELDGDGRALAAELWDLAELARAYDGFVRWAGTLVPDVDGLDERTAYARRTELVHEWRKFLFRDPGLPDAVLPADWAGDRAAACFDRLSSALLPRASAYVDTCLDQQGVS